jgi:CheY-like chemotaxis protein
MLNTQDCPERKGRKMNARTTPRVLVVDDDPVVGRSFDRVLSGKGYAVVTAPDGAEALRKIAAEEYDAVFTDIRMPGQDGLSVAEQIKSQRPWLPVVIVSGFATPESEARARAAGVSAVLHKPLSPRMIEESAAEAMHERLAARAALDAGTPAEPAVPSVAVATHALTPTAEPVTVPAAPTSERRFNPAWAAPLLTLAYVVLFPLFGLVVLIVAPLWFGVKAIATRPGRIARWLRDVALFVAAPFLGLLYIVTFPFIGLGALAWVALKAASGRRGHG